MRTALALIAGGVALDQFVVVAKARQLVTMLGIFVLAIALLLGFG
jgi:uncharacterized membrane protein YidH (DUF202 family)